jgi:hypothetical protein
MAAMSTILTRPDATIAIRRGAARLLRRMGHAVVSEMVFASGRRADLVAVTPVGHILVVEVKSCLDDFRADRKWPDYRDYCDMLVFAVDPAFPCERLPPEAGLICADAYGGEWMRDGATHPLTAARRKAVIVQFARLAALRLQALDDPEQI